MNHYTAMDDNERKEAQQGGRRAPDGPVGPLVL